MQTHVQDHMRRPTQQPEMVYQAYIQDVCPAWHSKQEDLATCCLLLQGPDPVHQLPEHQPRQCDICIANILQGPLLDLQPRLSGYVKPGGMLLLSGILTSQVMLPMWLCCMYVSCCIAVLPMNTSVTASSSPAVTNLTCWVLLSWCDWGLFKAYCAYCQAPCVSDRKCAYSLEWLGCS